MQHEWMCVIACAREGGVVSAASLLKQLVNLLIGGLLRIASEVQIAQRLLVPRVLELVGLGWRWMLLVLQVRGLQIQWLHVALAVLDPLFDFRLPSQVGSRVRVGAGIGMIDKSLPFFA